MPATEEKGDNEEVKQDGAEADANEVHEARRSSKRPINRILTDHEVRLRHWRIGQLARDGKEHVKMQDEGQRFIIGEDVVTFEEKGICPRVTYKASRAATDLLRRSSRTSGPVW